jgi:hypothetical protein
MKKVFWALAALTIVLGITTAATGGVAGFVTGAGIKDYSVTSVDLKNHTVQAHDMSQALLTTLRNPMEADHSIMADYSDVANQALSADKATTADSATNATNAATLGGYLPTSFARTARGTQGAIVALTASYQTLAKLSIVAPNPGFVFVTSTANVEGGTAEAETASVALARLREADVVDAASTTTAASVGSGTPLATMAANWVFPVETAGAHTYVLEAYQDGGDAVNVAHAVVTAIYVPFGSTGGTAP